MVFVVGLLTGRTELTQFHFMFPTVKATFDQITWIIEQ